MINKLKNNGTAGWDGFTNNMLKRCKQVLLDILVYLINYSMYEGIFPDILKISVVRPIHKKGNTSDVTNYRPITLTSVFAKIYEKILLTRITKFLNSNNILVQSQHGFRKKLFNNNCCWRFYS